MSWLDVTEWPELDFQCDGNRNRPINPLIFILLLLKLTVPQLVKQLLETHGTGKFTTPPSARWIQSRSVSSKQSHSFLVHTKALYVFFSFIRATCPAHLVLHD